MSRADLLHAIAASQDAVFSYEQAIACGYTPSAIERRVDRRTWRRVHTGVFAICGAPFTVRSAQWAALLATGPDAFLSHRTAAAVHELKGFEHMRILEVIVPHRRGLAVPGVTIHRPRRIVEGDPSVVRGLAVASVERTIFDLAAVVSKRAVEPALDDALVRRLTTFDALCSRLDLVRVPGIPGVRVMADVLGARSSDPAMQSILEQRFFRLLAAAGIPLPQAQWDVFAVDGSFIGRVDFAFVDTKLAIEVDGYGFHADRRAFQRDRFRQNALVQAGWTVLRFTCADLTIRPDEVVASVRRLLTA